ncbi:GbsR/MarR family transcriptional regulator [Aquimarina sp. W85]|uniref:GbsR/MarR family transcriptional regulator n=1 Tax=Aquimarina rhodophyticola TaxID=3342246 RepID=UPI0036728F83
MDFTEAKEQLLQTWGVLGDSWGINKTTAQIHALLFISPKPLSMEEIMEQLKISRGSTSTNLKALINWGIIYKENQMGERKEYFIAEKDVYALARQIANERSKREIKPALATLNEISQIKKDGTSETREFIKQTQALLTITKDIDKLFNLIGTQEHTRIQKMLLQWLANTK